MTKDQLYLLKPDFYDGDQGPFFCPGCVEVFGVLESHPPLKETVEIHFVDFARPRLELVPLLGEAHQSCPVLVLADASKAPENSKHANGRSFIDDPRAIADYWAVAYGTPRPY